MWRRLGMFTAALACAGLAQLCLAPAERLAREEGLSSRLAAQERGDAPPAETILISSLLGGLRGIALTALWLRAEEARVEGQRDEMVDIYKLITRLQPGHTAAWAYMAWDLSFNIPVELDDEEKVFWVFRAIESLRSEGIPRNPESAELSQELAWIFLFKVGADIDPAHPLYRAQLARDTAQALDGLALTDWKLFETIAELREAYPDEAALLAAEPYATMRRRLLEADPSLDLAEDWRMLLTAPPEGLRRLLREDAIARPLGQVALWYVGGRIDAKMGMDPRRMYEICEWHGLGAIDWRKPEAHALYWAKLAKETRLRRYPDSSSMRDQYIINHALMKLVASGDAVMAGSGQLFFVPDYRVLPATIKIMDEALARFDAISAARSSGGEASPSAMGMRAGYENFLVNMAINAWLDQEPEATAFLLGKLKEVSANPDEYELGAEAFVARELRERLQTMSNTEMLSLMQTFYGRACERLLLGDRQGYLRRKAWVVGLHRGAQKRAAERYEDAEAAARAVPPLNEVLRQALTLIVLGKLPSFDPGEDKARLQRLLPLLDRVEPEVMEAFRRNLQAPPKPTLGGAGESE